MILFTDHLLLLFSYTYYEVDFMRKIVNWKNSNERTQEQNSNKLVPIPGEKICSDGVLVNLTNRNQLIYVLAIIFLPRIWVFLKKIILLIILTVIVLIVIVIIACCIMLRDDGLTETLLSIVQLIFTE